MTEYIEREAVLAEADYDGNFNLVIPAKKVRNIPAADVAPVVHGEWKYYNKQGIAVCTNCSFERNVDDNFGRAIACPNCGADMRERKNDE